MWDRLVRGRSCHLLAIVLCAFWALNAGAQQTPKPQPPLPPTDTVPHSTAPQVSNHGEWKDDEGFTHRADSGGFSSSKEQEVDLSPPPDDAKAHPNSAQAVHEAEDAAGLLEGDELGGIQEFRPWDPHKAAKDIEVGEYYFKTKNYHGALDRFQEALYYQYNNATATFRVAECQEKLGDSDEARQAYDAYLKLLPEGPFAEKARQALSRLGAKSNDREPAPGPSQAQQR